MGGGWGGGGVGGERMGRQPQIRLGNAMSFCSSHIDNSDSSRACRRLPARLAAKAPVRPSGAAPGVESSHRGWPPLSYAVSSTGPAASSSSACATTGSAATAARPRLPHTTRASRPPGGAVRRLRAAAT